MGRPVGALEQGDARRATLKLGQEPEPLLPGNLVDAGEHQGVGPGQGAEGFTQEAPGQQGAHRRASLHGGRQAPGTGRVDQHQIEVPREPPMLESVVEKDAVGPQLDEFLAGPYPIGVLTDRDAGQREGQELGLIVSVLGILFARTVAP